MGMRTTVQPVLPLVRALVDELGPLAASVDKTISIDLPADLVFAGPVEVADVILANLLLNAIQHGAGAVPIGSLEESVVITNAVATDADAPGSGFGHGIVDRLASRVNWRVERVPRPDTCASRSGSPDGGERLGRAPTGRRVRAADRPDIVDVPRGLAVPAKQGWIAHPGPSRAVDLGPPGFEPGTKGL